MWVWPVAAHRGLLDLIAWSAARWQSVCCVEKFVVKNFGLVGAALMGVAEVLGNLGCVGWSARSVGALGALVWICCFCE